MRGQTWSQCTCAAAPAGLSTCQEERLRTSCVQAAWSLTSAALRHSEPFRAGQGREEDYHPQQKAQVKSSSISGQKLQVPGMLKGSSWNLLRTTKIWMQDRIAHVLVQTDTAGRTASRGEISLQAAQDHEGSRRHQHTDAAYRLVGQALLSCRHVVLAHGRAHGDGTNRFWFGKDRQQAVACGHVAAGVESSAQRQPARQTDR